MSRELLMFMMMLTLVLICWLIAGTFLCAFPFLIGEKTQYEGTWGDEGDKHKWKKALPFNTKIPSTRRRSSTIIKNHYWSPPTLTLMIIPSTKQHMIIKKSPFDPDTHPDDRSSQLRRGNICAGRRLRWRRIARWANDHPDGGGNGWWSFWCVTYCAAYRGHQGLVRHGHHFHWVSVIMNHHHYI